MTAENLIRLAEESTQGYNAEELSELWTIVNKVDRKNRKIK